MSSEIVMFDAGELFTKNPSGVKLPGWSEPSAFTPAVNPYYHFPAWSVDVVMWIIHVREPLFLFGPTGCGKTTCIKQVVAKLNYPVYEITGHSRLEFPDLVGHHVVIDGDMSYEYGPLAKAMRDGGLFLLNEIDLLDPSTAAGLNSILDGSPLVIPENGGEIIKPSPMFRFACTANSNGNGDETGMYQGVLRQNMALLDRMMAVRADYLSPDIEESLLQYAVPQLPKELVGKMVEYAGAVRNLFVGKETNGMDEPLDITLSTRALIRWAQFIVMYKPIAANGIDLVEYAFDRAFGFRASTAGSIVLAELRQRIFG